MWRRRSTSIVLVMFYATAAWGQVPVELSTHASLQSFEAQGQAAWRYAGVRLAVRPQSGYAGFELRRSERWKRSETVAIGDFYRTLWQGAYANLRVAGTPNAVVHPELDVLVELFQALDNRWIPAVKLRQMRFSESNVWIVSPAIGKYWKRWYARAQVTVSDTKPDASAFGTVTLRRLLTPSDDFAELRLGFGRDVVSTGTLKGFEAGRSWSITARSQHFPSSRLGISPAITFSDDHVLGRRLAVTLALIARRG